MASKFFVFKAPEFLTNEFIFFYPSYIGYFPFHLVNVETSILDKEFYSDYLSFLISKFFNIENVLIHEYSSFFDIFRFNDTKCNFKIDYFNLNSYDDIKEFFQTKNITRLIVLVNSDISNFQDINYYKYIEVPNFINTVYYIPNQQLITNYDLFIDAVMLYNNIAPRGNLLFINLREYGYCFFSNDNIFVNCNFNITDREARFYLLEIKRKYMYTNMNATIYFISDNCFSLKFEVFGLGAITTDRLSIYFNRYYTNGNFNFNYANSNVTMEGFIYNNTAYITNLHLDIAYNDSKIINYKFYLPRFHFKLRYSACYSGNFMSFNPITEFISSTYTENNVRSKIIINQDAIFIDLDEPFSANIISSDMLSLNYYYIR
ncbi:MAG: hypothetical protein QXW35_03635 [Candidatus Aenigmatarchaeota archaeon]